MYDKIIELPIAYYSEKKEKEIYGAHAWVMKFNSFPFRTGSKRTFDDRFRIGNDVCH
jgi:hypothetical protein